MSFEIQTCQLTIPTFPQAKILVKVGEWVPPEALLAQSRESLAEFNLAKILKTSPQKVSRYLLVPLGTQVKEGDILAQKKSILEKLVFKSPSSGVLTELTPDGFLKIEVVAEQEVKSPVKAHVTGAKPGEVILEFTAATLKGDWGLGNGDWGEIEILDKEEVGVENLPPEAANKILVIRGQVSAGFVHKAEALGVCGILAGNFDTKIKTDDLALVAIGEKDGLIPVDIWHRLQKYKGKKAQILGQEKTLRIPLD